MTWRELREQLNNMSEDRWDEPALCLDRHDEIVGMIAMTTVDEAFPDWGEDPEFYRDNYGIESDNQVLIRLEI